MTNLSTYERVQPDWGRREIFLVLLLVVISLLVHSFFVLKGFGERDAAILGTRALVWHKMGSYQPSLYVHKTSPLYLFFLKSVLDIGVSAENLATVMNWTNAVTGSLLLCPLYFFWRFLVRPAEAVAGCIFLSFAPTFWLGSIYGMPHMLALSCFVLSVLCFAVVCRNGFRQSLFFAALSMFFACCAMNWKADVVLCYGVFLALVIYFGRKEKALFLFAACIPLVAIATVVILTKLIYPNVEKMAHSVQSWHDIYPFRPQNLWMGYDKYVLPKAMGRNLFLAVFVAIGYLIYRRQFRLLFIIAAWSIPSAMFWGFIHNNSARHMMFSYSAMVFLPAIAIGQGLAKKRIFFWVAIFFLLILNYFSCPPSYKTVAPSSQIFASQPLIQDWIDHNSKGAVLFMDIPDRQKAIVGVDSRRYAEFEMWKRAIAVNLIERKPNLDEFCHVRFDNGLEQDIGFILWGDMKAGLTVPPKGWSLYTIDKECRIMYQNKECPHLLE